MVDLWADIVCPWCYIARHRLRSAVQQWERPGDVTVRHRAFELDPQMEVGKPVPVVDYLEAKYGGGRRAGEEMTRRVTEVAAESGLALDLSRAVKANSLDAHRLVLLGRSLGGAGLEEAVLERLFAAHFVEGLQIDDRDTLLSCAGEAGLDAEPVTAALEADASVDAVRADEAQASSLGVSAVPFAVANMSVAVSGAQSVPVYLELLAEGARHPVP